MQELIHKLVVLLLLLLITNLQISITKFTNADEILNNFANMPFPSILHTFWFAESCSSNSTVY